MSSFRFPMRAARRKSAFLELSMCSIESGFSPQLGSRCATAARSAPRRSIFIRSLLFLAMGCQSPGGLPSELQDAFDDRIPFTSDLISRYFLGSEEIEDLHLFVSEVVLLDRVEAKAATHRGRLVTRDDVLELILAPAVPGTARDPQETPELAELAVSFEPGSRFWFALSDGLGAEAWDGGVPAGAYVLKSRRIDDERGWHLSRTGRSVDANGQTWNLQEGRWAWLEVERSALERIVRERRELEGLPLNERPAR